MLTPLPAVHAFQRALDSIDSDGANDLDPFRPLALAVRALDARTIDGSTRSPYREAVERTLESQAPTSATGIAWTPSSAARSIDTVLGSDLRHPGLWRHVERPVSSTTSITTLTALDDDLRAASAAYDQDVADIVGAILVGHRLQSEAYREIVRLGARIGTMATFDRPPRISDVTRALEEFDHPSIVQAHTIRQRLIFGMPRAAAQVFGDGAEEAVTLLSIVSFLRTSALVNSPIGVKPFRQEVLAMICSDALPEARAFLHATASERPKWFAPAALCDLGVRFDHLAHRRSIQDKDTRNKNLGYRTWLRYHRHQVWFDATSNELVHLGEPRLHPEVDGVVAVRRPLRLTALGTDDLVGAPTAEEHDIVKFRSSTRRWIPLFDYDERSVDPRQPLTAAAKAAVLSRLHDDGVLPLEQGQLDLACAALRDEATLPTLPRIEAVAHQDDDAAAPDPLREYDNRVFGGKDAKGRAWLALVHAGTDGTHWIRFSRHLARLREEHRTVVVWGPPDYFSEHHRLLRALAAGAARDLGEEQDLVDEQRRRDERAEQGELVGDPTSFDARATPICIEGMAAEPAERLGLVGLPAGRAALAHLARTPVLSAVRRHGPAVEPAPTPKDATATHRRKDATSKGAGAKAPRSQRLSL